MAFGLMCAVVPKPEGGPSLVLGPRPVVGPSPVLGCKPEVGPKLELGPRLVGSGPAAG